MCDKRRLISRKRHLCKATITIPRHCKKRARELSESMFSHDSVCKIQRCWTILKPLGVSFAFWFCVYLNKNSDVFLDHAVTPDATLNYGAPSLQQFFPPESSEKKKKLQRLHNSDRKQLINIT